MKDKHTDAAVPVQHDGKEKNIEASIEAATSQEAEQLFALAKQRFLNVNSWAHICGKLSAVFQLTDDEGNKISTKPAVGNYFKIDIPGPGTVAGKGYDWVRVEAVEEHTADDNSEENMLIRVRPSDNPSTPEKEVAHFFSDKATSNFFLERKNKIVTAAVYGRNEVPNTTEANAIDKTRNAVVGSTASAGLSDPQWKALVHGVLGKS